MHRSLSTALRREVLATIAYLQKLIKDMNKGPGEKTTKFVSGLNIASAARSPRAPYPALRQRDRSPLSCQATFRFTWFGAFLSWTGRDYVISRGLGSE
jgi:hypothetical protein